MSPTIRIDDEVFNTLQKKATPFIDTPNDVLRRVLGLDGGSLQPNELRARKGRDEGRTRHSRRARKPRLAGRPVQQRAPAGSLLPSTRYELPILEAINELGGSASAVEVIDLVGKKVDRELTQRDREVIQSGAIRWKNRVQFVRLNLVEGGLLVKESERGVWAISEKGRARLREANRSGQSGRQ